MKTNPENKEGWLMWRDDEVDSHSTGTKTIYERYFIKTQCWVHSDADWEGREVCPRNPAYVILKAIPYKQCVHLECIEARDMFERDIVIDCKNSKCPHWESDRVRNETKYLVEK